MTHKILENKMKLKKAGLLVVTKNNKKTNTIYSSSKNSCDCDILPRQTTLSGMATQSQSFLEAVQGKILASIKLLILKGGRRI